jgi:hypothetical protein
MTAYGFHRSLTCVGIIVSTFALLAILGPSHHSHADDGGGPAAPIVESVPTNGSPRGLYAQIAAGDKLPTPSEWQIPYISGFNLARQWNILEPSSGIYNWADFDQLVADATTYGKQVILGVRTGLVVDSASGGKNTGVPAWYSGQTYACDNGDIGPIPYDPMLVADLAALYNAMIQRYDPYPAVVGYGLSAWQQWAFYEMGPPCRNTATANDLNGLLAAGYTREKIETSMQILVATAKRLTTKSLRVAIGYMIDQDATTLDIQSTHDFIMTPLQQLLKAQLAYFGKTNLKVGTGDPQRIWNNKTLLPEEQLIYQQQPYVFWQTTPVSSGGPSTAADWIIAGDTGLHYGMQFLEVRRQDIVNPTLTEILSCLHYTLLAGGGHCGHD